MVRHVLQEARINPRPHRKGADDSVPSFGNKSWRERGRVLLSSGELEDDVVMLGESSQHLEEFGPQN
jgi:hypothetical protein